MLKHIILTGLNPPITNLKIANTHYYDDLIKRDGTQKYWKQ